MSFQVLRNACAAVLVSTFSLTAGAATAQTAPPNTPQTIVVAKTGLNLLRGSEPRVRSKLRRRVAIGKGSYICSPAGFGKRSRCYSN